MASLLFFTFQTDSYHLTSARMESTACFSLQIVNNFSLINHKCKDYLDFRDLSPTNELFKKKNVCKGLFSHDICIC